MQRPEDPGGDLARRVRHCVNPLANPFQRASVAVGEIHKLPADGLRIEAGVKRQNKGSRSQSLLEHAEPHAHHHLARQGRVLIEGRVLLWEPDRNWTASVPGGPVPQIIRLDPTSVAPQFASHFVRNFPTIWLDLFEPRL